VRCRQAISSAPLSERIQEFGFFLLLLPEEEIRSQHHGAGEIQQLTDCSDAMSVMWSEWHATPFDRYHPTAGRDIIPEMLDRVSIASPCLADWDEMPGTDQVRHCGQCNKSVYNLSAMTRREAEALLREAEGQLCARLYRRADGTILTENCPAGLRAVGRRVSRFAGAAMSAVATLSSATAAQFPMFPIPSALLEARSSVTGIVKDASGRGLSDAMIVVTRSGSESSLVRSSDSTGHFRVELLALGSYTVRIQVPGFMQFTKQVILRPRQEYNITADLRLGSVGALIEIPYAK